VFPVKKQADQRAFGRLLNVAEAADRLNVSPRMVRRMKADGRLPFVKVGAHVRFLEEDLDMYIRNARVDPAETWAVFPATRRAG
jgi:excisionase family DNA binding protein